jgi:hypothetical protein
MLLLLHPSRSIASLVDVATRSWLRVVLAIVAVAHRRLGRVHRHNLDWLEMESPQIPWSTLIELGQLRRAGCCSGSRWRRCRTRCGLTSPLPATDTTVGGSYS